MACNLGSDLFFDGGIWLALFMVWLLFSASGFMGGTLAARVNVLILLIFQKEFEKMDPINLWIWEKSKIKCGMSQVEWKA